MDGDDELLQLSGLQHFAFCPRQWALIHIENQWAENVRTVDGNIFHERAHDEEQTEKRGGLLVTRGMRVQSSALGVSGQCDVVEFHQCEDGIALHGREGKWQVSPVEYKKGSPKEHDADQLQLCAQALCLEEMLACTIQEGVLYYGETRRRLKVALADELRARTKELLGQMQEHYRRGYTPRPKPAPRCKACSLANLCLPNLTRALPVAAYLKTAMEDGSQ